MVILNLKMDNILLFDDFKINFSYPIKLRNTIIKNENLEHFPNFRYKKVNVFLGANASGKTSLVTCMWQILSFLQNKIKSDIENMVNDIYKESNIEIDLAEENENGSFLYRIKVRTYYDNDLKILVAYRKFELNNTSSYENMVKTLDNANYDFNDYLLVLNELNISLGWNIVLPGTELGFDRVEFDDLKNENDRNEYLFILSQVLKTLDPSITEVNASKDSDDAYVITHENKGKIIVQNGNKISDILYLSSGTKYGFNIANIIYSIKKHHNGIYFIDEQFSYVNSDVEEAILATMVLLLGPNEQLFFTTHNSNVLNLRFPFHSFYFMKKEVVNKKRVISVSCASEVENRNNVPAKSLLDNDVFGTAPKLDRIFEIGE